MAEKILLDVVKLRQLLEYDPQTGKLFWRKRSPSLFPSVRSFNVWNTRYADREALVSIDTHGYRQGRILRQSYLAHRVAFALTYGRWPVGEIDHINGDRADNRIENLREATSSENSRNRCRRSDNTSGCVGVYKAPDSRSWTARISSIHLGSFATFEEAVAARKAAERQHGYHPNHGR